MGVGKMILLNLNSNKELSIRKTSDNFTGENGFETIRIISNNEVSGNQLQSLRAELYVSNFFDENWSTFNDCIPIIFEKNETGNFVFETPVKQQYTVYPKIGFYIKLTGTDGIIGKTNTVVTSVLHHKDSTIDTSNSIELFDKYKEDIPIKSTQEAIKENERRLTRIYFKKNCDNWTTPRIYLFNKKTAPHYYNSSFCNWDESPYMMQDKSDMDLYYFDAPIDCYQYVVFFCDISDGGNNYKTSDLLIPKGTQYPHLYYWQSPIGYDGIWANMHDKTFNLYIQTNMTKDINQSCLYHTQDLNYEIYCDEKQVTGVAMGEIGVSVSHTPVKYKCFKIPLSAQNITIKCSNLYQDENTENTYKDDNGIRWLSINYKAFELCYNIPIIYHYVDTVRGVVQHYDFEIFNGSNDPEFMFETRYALSEYQLYNDVWNVLCKDLKENIQSTAITYSNGHWSTPSSGYIKSGYYYYMSIFGKPLCRLNGCIQASSSVTFSGTYIERLPVYSKSFIEQKLVDDYGNCADIWISSNSSYLYYQITKRIENTPVNIPFSFIYY